VPPPAWLRRLRQHFGISAPRMTVRTRLAWPWRALLVTALCGAIAGMWWWGFDFGRLPGGLDHGEIVAKVAALEADATRLRSESAQMRAKSSRLESELAMREGALAALSRQALELQSENAQLREELAFLRKLVTDANKQVGLSIQRLAIEQVRDDLYRYSMLIVRGGNPVADFEGNLALQVTVQPPASGGGLSHTVVVTLPDDQPELAGPLRLKFKYYQRVEGTFRVPSGARVRAVTARAFENGHANPRTTRSLNLS
jgi:hypothetical protein